MVGLSFFVCESAPIPKDSKFYSQIGGFYFRCLVFYPIDHPGVDVSCHKRRMFKLKIKVRPIFPKFGKDPLWIEIWV
jgi:hypothetical protein